MSAMTPLFPFQDVLEQQFITFVPLEPDPSCLSEARARAAAGVPAMLEQFPGAEISAWFGAHTVILPASVTTWGKALVEDEDRLVWLIRFASISLRRTGRGGSMRVSHEKWVIVDAGDGRVVRAFSVR
jgi:hypothetical protein